MSKGYKVLRFLFGWLFRFIYRTKAVFPENEPKDDRPYIICANHISALDPILICAVLKHNQPRYMAKESLFKIPLLSSLIRCFGAYPINRTGSALSAIKNSVQIIEQNKCVGIFPQGHRHPCVDPRSTQIKNGVGMIASKSGCDLLPICIKPANYKIGLFKRTYIIIGEPVRYSDIPVTEDMQSSEKNKVISDYVFDKICSLGENYGV